MELAIAALLLGGLFVIFGLKKPSNQSPNVNTSTSADVASLSAKLQSKLPYRLGQWSDQIANIAFSTVPQGLTADYWASLIAGIIDQESLGGDALAPKGAVDGVGDFANRWRVDVPFWMQDLLTGQTRVGFKGVSSEVAPPKPFDDRVSAWGYGLMQIDFEFNRNYILSGSWRDPANNIQTGAQKLADNYASTQDITTAIARYNGRGEVAAAYAQKVLDRASKFGVA